MPIAMDKSNNVTMPIPTAALALRLGQDTVKWQLMKASFFVEDDLGRRSIISNMTDRGRDSLERMVPNKMYLCLCRTLASSLYMRTMALKLVDSLAPGEAYPGLFVTSTRENRGAAEDSTD